MVKSLRKVVPVIAAVLFLLNSSNVFLYIHLAEDKTDAGHDHNKCPVCQQAAVNKIKAVIENNTVIFELPHIFYTTVYAPETFLKSLNFLPLYPRAPPAIS